MSNKVLRHHTNQVLQIFTLFWVTTCCVLAQGNSVTTFENSSETNLEEIEVIGVTEQDSGLIDAPVKVEVISNKYLEQQQYQDLSEGIADIPGVTTLSSDRRAGSKSAVIQGFGENSVLVMIDGVPVGQNSSFGFDLSQMATSNVEKVEVIKGAASSLYGSQAMGGVINIVTKKMSKKPRVELEASGGQIASQSGGQNRNLKAHLENSFGDVGVKATYSLREEDPFDLDSQTLNADGVESKREQANLRIQKKFGKFLTFADALYLKGTINSTSSRPFSSNSFGQIQNVTDSQTLNVKVGAEGKLGPGTLRAILNYEENKDDLSLSDRPDTPFVETRKLSDFDGQRVDLQYKDVAIGTHKLSVGALFRQNTVNQTTITQSTPEIIVETTDIEDRAIRSYEAFVQDNFWLGNFEISPGARYQYDQDFGSFVAPKINISHFGDLKNTGFKTWLTVGTGYRAPSIKERFFTLDHSFANYIVVGNENLQPEESVSFQLGEEISWSRKNAKASLYGNLFLNRISNLIEISEGESTASQTVFTYQNFDRVISRGFELGFKGSINKFNFMLNGSYTETIDRQTNLLIANRPLYAGLLTIGYRFTPGLELLSMSRYTGNSFVDNENQDISPGFTTTDLKLNYRYSKKISSFISLRNILNETRDAAIDTVEPVFDGRPARGREIFAGINLRAL